MQSGTRRTFVLVHGASHGGWCWARVADRLRQDGHRVHAPTLTGTGERSHQYDDGIGLSCHADDVVNEILWGDLEHVVLCGHSYSGMLVSTVADRIPDRIRSLVYLNAFLPQNGQSVVDILGIAPPTGPVPPMSAEMMNVNERDRAWVNGKLTPQPPKTLTDPVALTGSGSRIASKHYILATLSAAPPLKTAFDRVATLADWQTHELESGHLAMIDKPEELAGILLSI